MEENKKKSLVPSEEELKKTEDIVRKIISND